MARIKRSKGHKTVSMEKLREVVQHRAEGFLQDKNITSIGIGYKESEGKRTNELAIQFTVRKKVPDTQLESIGTTPIPKTIDVGGIAVPTDVLEREYKPAHELVKSTTKDIRKQRLATVQPGISVSHPSGSAGTLGLIVYDTHTGAQCMLSNWHVLHTPQGVLGDVVVQPGPFDDNRVALNRAGTLLRSHLGVAGDCAIARIEGRAINSTVLDLSIQPKKLARPNLGDRVVKSGRTTGVTFGIVRRVATTSKINYGGSVGEQNIGGFEIGPDDSHPASDRQISMGGDSGSSWLVTGKTGKATEILVGLHFAGEGNGDPDDHALACAVSSVFEKLEIALAPPAIEPETEEISLGYDDRFLPIRIALPTLTGAIKNDAFVLNGSRVIPYTHFSVILSRKRRMPRVVAWNIDGGKIRQLSRTGIGFVFDTRVPEEFQTGDDVYANNKLDRGHIARRADLVWGTPAEAKKANKDSFFFTNITPQHQSFNQSQRHGLWGQLENAIFEDVDVENLHVSVMGGPLFRNDDIPFRGILIPRDFWKLIAFVDAADHQLKVKVFVLTQDDLLNDIEALELDEFRLFQISVAELSTRSGINFSALRSHDDFQAERVPESVGADGRRRAVREVFSREDLFG
jgi:endonuclease G